MVAILSKGRWVKNQATIDETTGALSPNELQRLHLKTEHQGSSSNSGH